MPASAATYWQVPSGDWLAPAHWDAGVPTAADTALIDNGGTASLLAEADDGYVMHRSEVVHPVDVDRGDRPVGGIHRVLRVVG